MASSIFPPLSFSSITLTSSSSLFPLSPKLPCTPSKPKRHRVSCNGRSQNDNHPKQKSQLEPSHNILGNRRDILIGFSGLSYGAAALSLTNSNIIINPLTALAAPVSPDLKSCGLPSLPPGAKPTKCCPPPSTKVTDFTFPTNQPLRVRKPAHLVTGDELAKYKEALKAMKALPSDDPRSFTQQASIHCAYCHNSYHQVGYPDLDLQVHFSWIFLPFHRWYLYFYERILGSLINDPTFALPFWNWDAPAGMEIPAIYADSKSPFYDSLRNANHQPPVLIDLNWNKKAGDTTGNVDANLKLMYRQVVEAKRATCFHGKAFRAGDPAFTNKVSGSGTFELSPHNIVHAWTGDITNRNNEDMGALYSSARDPLFYSHHSNVDRMWKIWKTLDGGRKDFDDPDWLDASFFFYDENKNLVRVTIKDSLDTSKLGYDYLPVEIPWLNTKPIPRRTKAQRAEAEKKTLTTKTALAFPLTLGLTPVSTVVTRAKKSRSKKEKEEAEEVLVFEIEFDRRASVKFDVLINEEEDSGFATPVNREFAGSFVNVTHTQTQKNMITNTNFTLGISDILDDLEADDDDSIVVTLVPQYGEGIVINNIKIYYESC